MNKEEKFMRGLYESAYNDIKDLKVDIDRDKEEIMKLIGYATMIYDLDKDCKDAEKFITVAVINMLTKEDNELDEFFEDGFLNYLNEVCDFYGFELLEEQKIDIIKESFKDKNYIDRKKDHIDFLKVKLLLIAKKVSTQNKVSKKDDKKKVNKNKLIGTMIAGAFATHVYKMRRLYISEITRIRNNVYLEFNKGQHVQYNSVLEKNTCADCESMHGAIFKTEEAYDIIPQHANCKCYWTTLEGKEI